MTTSKSPAAAAIRSSIRRDGQAAPRRLRMRADRRKAADGADSADDKEDDSDETERRGGAASMCVHGA